MWSRLRDWLDHGAIPADDVVLETDLGAAGSHLNRSDQLVLESKENMQKRGLASPDRGDALALTFARRVLPASPVEREDLFSRLGSYSSSWMS
jgi:hypothetical protein